MKKDKAIYWITTAIITLMMLFSAFTYLTNPTAAEGFKHLGFPGYFRIELAIAKIMGALVLIIPAIPKRIKEWAYVGFSITFISASIAHICSGDPLMNAISPLIFLVVLLVSAIYLYRVQSKT